MRFRSVAHVPSSSALPKHNGQLKYRKQHNNTWQLGAVVQVYLLLAPMLEHTNNLPRWLSLLLTVAGSAVLLRALITFKRWGDETPCAGLFFGVFAALLVELTIDNAFTWVVSATDISKYSWTPPLQDNVEILLDRLKLAHPWTEVLWKPEWINIKQKLVALIMLAFSVIFDQVPYSGFAMMTRVAACIAISRIIRTVAFLLTVLPNPRPGCYNRRFPPLPDSWWGFWKVGFGQMRGMGGCNDLIISGHCIIYVMAPLVFQTYYPGWTAALLWLAVIHSCVRAPMTKQHYAVDMFLAVVVTGSVWMHLDFICPARQCLPARHPADPPDRRGPLQWLFVTLIFIVLLSLFVIIIGGGA